MTVYQANGRCAGEGCSGKAVGFRHLAVVAHEDEQRLGVQRSKLLEAHQLLARERGVEAGRRARLLQLEPASSGALYDVGPKY